MTGEDKLSQREKALFLDHQARPRDGMTVIRLRCDPLPVDTFAPLLAQFVGLIRADAAELCEQESGFLLDNVAADIAAQVAAALQAHGEECFVVSASKIIMLPAPKLVQKLEFTKAGLSLKDPAGASTEVGWDKLTALVAAQANIKDTHARKHAFNWWSALDAKVPFYPARGWDPDVEGVATAATGAVLGEEVDHGELTAATRHEFLDLLGLDGPLYFRINAWQFDFSVLGGQLQPVTTANLLTLARWLLTYDPTLQTNLDVELLKRTGTASMRGHSLPGITQMSQWLLNLAKFGHKALPPRASA